MKTIKLAGLALISLALIYPAAAQSTSFGVRLEAGIAKEEVDGDLKSAMDIYQKIATDSSAPRDVRAKALLRLAGCYEKLGRQASQVYEQIMRDYPDQPAAAQARTRLASLKQQEHPAAPPTTSVRKVELSKGMGNVGASDTDGQRVMYMGLDENLYFGDVAGHTKRLIFKAQPGDVSVFRASRDFSMAWFELGAKPNRPAMLAVIRTDGTGYRELIRDDPRETILGERFRFDASWSWDDRYLSVWDQRGVHLWLVSVSDGQRRELLHTGEIVKAVFSPDGRFVAYETAPQPGQVGPFRIFTLPTQGGASHLVYESDPRFRGLDRERHALLDWTADNSHLAIADTRYGKAALYLLPVKNGTKTGAPVLVRQGDFSNGYITRAGTLVFESNNPGRNNQVHLASFAPDGHLGSWRRLNLAHGNVGFPSFSPDGRQIAYTAADEDMAGVSLFSYNLSTGQERLIHRFDEEDVNCQFAVHLPKLFCVSRKSDGTADLVSIRAESSEVEPVASFPQYRLIYGFFGATNDEHALYFWLPNPREAVRPIVRWELATGKETVESVLEFSSDTFQFPSLDSRWQVGVSRKALSVRPISGGGWKPLASFNKPGDVKPRIFLGTTPDGKWILYDDTDIEGKAGLFRVAIAGGAPQRVGDFPIKEIHSAALSSSGDGHQIVATTIVNPPIDYDLWMLENFVPSAKQSGGAQ